MTASSSPARWFSRHRVALLTVLIAVGIALALHVAGTLAYLERAANYISFPATEDYGEGPVLYQIEALRAGDSIYHTISEPPYTVANYPPVFHLTTWLATAVVDDVLAAGRLVSFLSALGCAILIFTLVSRTQGEGTSPAARAFGGAVASLFFLNQATVVLWSLMARVDMLALAIGLMGMYVFELSLRRQSRALACLFGLIFVVAAFTKQNMIAAAAATFATAFILERRLAYAALSVALPTGLIGLALLQVASDGQFLLHSFSYNANDFQWNGISQRAIWIAALNPVELLLLIFGSIYLFISRRRRCGDVRTGPGAPSDFPLLLFGIFMAASLLNVFFSLKYGAAPNYYLEFTAAGALLLGMIAARIVADLPTRVAGPDYAKHRFLVVLGLLFLSWQVIHAWEIKYREPLHAIIPNMQRVIDLAASVDGPVISEDMVLLYRSGKPLFYDPFNMTQLAKEGRWNAEPVLDQMRRGDVPMVILTSEIGSRLYKERFPPGFTDALLTRYRVLDRFGHYTVYVPRQ